MNKNYDYKNLTPFKWFVLQNFPFIDEDFDAITNYQLFCKLGEEINKLIESMNLAGEQVEELTNFVNNYFDNLDVQEEINNKLDEMAEDGTLEEIVTSYLNIKSMLVFDNVENMKNSSSLINGSFAQTLGYYSKNDGGKATYKIRTITNSDVIDNSTIIPIGNTDLIAELIIDNIMCVDAFGCKGDNIQDDTEKLQIALNKCLNLRLNQKTYKITDTLTFRTNTKLEGSGIASKISTTINNGEPLFYNNEEISHFIFKDFYIIANHLNSKGFVIRNPYDNCIFKNIYMDKYSNTCIECGNNEEISQTLLIDNCMIYTSNQTTNDFPIVKLTKCYESNITNNKFLNIVGHDNDSPNIHLINVYDANIQGNSFTASSDCAIKISGTDCRYNRIISNTYESISGTDVIKLIGDVSDAIGQTLIIESGSYYNTTPRVLCTNAYQTFIIGLACTGGRRNLSLNIHSGSTQSPYGNCNIFTDNGAFTTRLYGITGANGQQKYLLQPNDSTTADYGLDLTYLPTGNKLTIDVAGNYFGFDKPGMRLKMKQPNGTVKYLGIDNNGTLQVYNTPT